MSELGYAKNFTDLLVWKKARELARDIFELTRTFPDEERFSLTDQIRRSSRSVGAQIAEAWAKRRYEKHFVSKLTDAEQNETQHWLIAAMDAGYVDRERIHDLGSRCKEIGAMLGRMISQSDRFCGRREQSSSVIKETNEENFFTLEPSPDLSWTDSASSQPTS